MIAAGMAGEWVVVVVVICTLASVYSASKEQCGRPVEVCC